MGKGVITAVERQARSKQRYNVFIDGELAFAVHEDVLIKHRLLKGESVDAGRLEEVLLDEERQSAYVKVLRWLGARHRTEKEIKAYLRRHKYEPAVVEEVLTRVRHQGYIDDERFSRTLAEERLKSHGKGKRWIRQELLHKGVDRSIVQETLADIDEEAEFRSAADIARKRWKSAAGKGDPRDVRRRLAAYLARRGYSPEIVQRAVRFVTSESDSDTWDDDAGEWSW
ncbi:RecX family transcriptional regulator [Paenibacillus alkalitolerans]|uniref:RecX family transcriptional regulator n=1 Tax=Paenibacillus alkalitolerans TaxID=2799335 RepID=UPI0018F30A7A|nr:RecX family transcriptional regulator [Paenibacillus alkalitolerans]